MYSEETMKEAAAAALEESQTPKEKLRNYCMSRGYNGILDIGRYFRILDKDRSFTLTIEEMTRALVNAGLELTEEEILELFQDFDTDDTGVIDYEEFLAGIRPEMNDDRKSIVEEAFTVLDESGDGKVTIEDFKMKYNAAEHPNVRAGSETEEEIWTRFISNIEGKTTEDGVITKNEFMDYYSGISNSIDDDEYFIQIIKSGYNL